MTLLRSKPSGYGIHDKLTSVEAELIDSQLPYAIDSRGGTYVVSTADIVLTGTKGVTFSNNLVTFNGGSISVNGPVMSLANNQLLLAASSDLQVQSGATFSGGLVTFNGGSITVDGPVMSFANNQLLLQATSDLQVLSTAEFSGNVTFDSGSTNFGNGAITPVNFNSNSFTEFKTGSTLTLDIAVALSGVGRVPGKFVTGPDAIHTFAAGDANYVRIPNISSNLIYTLTSVGAVAGDWMVFYYTGSGIGANTLTVKDDSAFTLGVTLNSGGTPKSVLWCVFTGASWQALGAFAWAF